MEYNNGYEIEGEGRAVAYDGMAYAEAGDGGRAAAWSIPVKESGQKKIK